MNDTIIPVFDLGGVFVDWNPMYLFRKLFESEEDAVWFHQNICTSDWNLEFDAGEIYSEGVAKLVTRFPKYWREIRPSMSAGRKPSAPSSRAQLIFIMN